jgi:hypothetical protein
MLMVLENREYGEVIGDPGAPFLNQLAARYGLATRAYATEHPSLPNYLEILAGTTFGITSDCDTCTVDGPVLVDQLASLGIAWRAYMEGMPSPCFTGSNADGYAKKHDPFMYVRHLVADPTSCRRVVPLAALGEDLAVGEPPFLWISPDLCHDGHDCSNRVMDSWLRDTIGSVQSSPWYRAGAVVIVTFDEGKTSDGCCGRSHGGHVATVVVAEGAPGAARLDRPVGQAGILRTVEDIYGIPHLGDAACPCAGDLSALLPGRSP